MRKDTRLFPHTRTRVLKLGILGMRQNKVRTPCYSMYIASFPGPHPASRHLQYGRRPRSQVLSQLPVACSTVKGLVPRASPSFPLLAVRSKASFPGPLPASRRLLYGQRPHSQGLSQLPVTCSTVKGLVPRASPSFLSLAVRSKASFPGPLPAFRHLQYCQRPRSQGLTQLPVACSMLNHTASDGKLGAWISLIPGTRLGAGLGMKLACNEASM